MSDEEVKWQVLLNERRLDGKGSEQFYQRKSEDINLANRV